MQWILFSIVGVCSEALIKGNGENMPGIEKVRFGLAQKIKNKFVSPGDTVELLLSITLDGGQGGRPGMKFYLQTDPSLPYKKASIKFAPPDDDKSQTFKGEINDRDFKNDAMGDFSPSWDGDKSRLLMTIPDMAVVSGDDGQNQITLNFSLALTASGKTEKSSKHSIQAWLVAADDAFETRTLEFIILPPAPNVTSLSLSGENNVHRGEEDDAVFFVRDFDKAAVHAVLGGEGVAPSNAEIYIYFKNVVTKASSGKIAAVFDNNKKIYESRGGLKNLQELLSGDSVNQIEARVSYLGDFASLDEEKKGVSSKKFDIKVFKNKSPTISVLEDSAAVVDGKSIKLSVSKKSIKSDVGISKVEYSLGPVADKWSEMSFPDLDDIFSADIVPKTEAPLNISKGFYVKVTDLCGSVSDVVKMAVPAKAYLAKCAGLNKIGLARDVRLHVLIYPIGYPEKSAENLINYIHSTAFFGDSTFESIKDWKKLPEGGSFVLPAIAFSSLTAGNGVSISEVEFAGLDLPDSPGQPYFWIIRCHATLNDAGKVTLPVAPISIKLESEFISKKHVDLQVGDPTAKYLYPEAKFHINAGGNVPLVLHTGDPIYLRGDFDGRVPIKTNDLHAYFSTDGAKSFNAVRRSGLVVEPNSTRFSVDVEKFMNLTSKKIENGALKIRYLDDDSSACIVGNINVRVQNELPIFSGSPTLTLSGAMLKGTVKFSPPQGEKGEDTRAGVRWDEGGMLSWTEAVPKQIPSTNVWEVDLPAVASTSIKKIISPELHLGTKDKKSLIHRHFIFSNAHDLLDVKIFADSKALAPNLKSLEMHALGDNHINRFKFSSSDVKQVYVRLSVKALVGIKSMNVLADFGESSAFKLISGTVKISPDDISNNVKFNFAKTNLQREWKGRLQLLALRDFLSTHEACLVEFAFAVGSSGGKSIRFIFEDPEEVGVNSKTTFNNPTEYILSIDNKK